MPAEQKSELAFLPLQADRSERPGVPGLTVVIIVIFVITIMIVMQVQSWEGAAEEEEECSIEGMPCIKVINTNFSLLTMIRLLIDYYHYF